MENLDVAVLRTLRDWRAAGRHALLATVVRTWGSSPRPVGSIMAAVLARLRGPVGLHIGSKTPPEIAISAMAEILAVKNGKDITA
jgi:xanthine/CO dehydrogenase XdhC/CoxF family maturation factor